MLGLPDAITTCLFDLDGVLTKTATLHAAAWKQMFDDFLRQRAQVGGAEFVPFDSGDYDAFVDGKPRADGTRSFLASRGIELPEGSPDDPPDAQTVNGLGNRKNQLVLAAIAAGRVAVYPGSVSYLRAARQAGLRCAVVSSSANCRAVLDSVGITGEFDTIVDGALARERHLPGKPAPDTFLAAAAELKAAPAAAAVFEDAQAGVAAGRAGRFGYVVGVDRVGQADALREHGADVVVSDLDELLARG